MQTTISDDSGKKPAWLRPRLRIERIADITRGGVGTGVDNCSQTNDGLQCG